MEQISSIGERLRMLRGNESQGAFAECVGTNVSSLSRYETGKTPLPLDLLGVICEKTGVSANWLLLGEGPMYRAESMEMRTPELVIEPPGPREVWIGGDLHRDVPVLAAVPAGDAKAVSDADYPPGYGIEGYILVPDPKDENAYALKVEGMSMSPRLAPGDTIVISPRRRDDLRYPICVVKIKGDDITIKYVKIQGVMAHLEPENPEFRAIELPVEDIEIIGRVIGWMRMLSE